MLDFQPLKREDREKYLPYLTAPGDRGCEYSFVNLYLWGRQKAAFVGDDLVLFCQYNRRSVYLYPVGFGNRKKTLTAIMEDAAQRGISCRLAGLTQVQQEELELLFPGKFQYHSDRNGFDYVYFIDDLADLKGRKFQKKRNHLNRFFADHPHFQVHSITQEHLDKVRAMVDNWYTLRQEENPDIDYCLERSALDKALRQASQLGLDGIFLEENGTVLAMTMGSQSGPETFDIHFEKALHRCEGCYAAINSLFARHIRQTYPNIQWLNREEDMGLEGLRKAKTSYCPHHMIEKRWALLLEDSNED